MKRQIRFGVFECNSSSTHSLTIMMKSDYAAWEDSGLYRYTNDYWRFRHVDNAPVDGKLYTKEEVIAFLKLADVAHGWESSNYDDEDVFEDNRKDSGFSLFGEERDDLEFFYQEFTTPSGETIVAFGEYGYDG